STFTNLVFMTEAAVNQFIDAKLENAKSVKNNMTDQQQNFDDIINLFDVFRIQVSFNETSFSKASELSFYQHLNHSCINIQTWHHCMCHMSMYKILKLCQIAKNINIDSMS